MANPERDKCPRTGLVVLSCKVADRCDCLDFPEADARAIEILAERHRRWEDGAGPA